MVVLQPLYEDDNGKVEEHLERCGRMQDVGNRSFLTLLNRSEYSTRWKGTGETVCLLRKQYISVTRASQSRMVPMEKEGFQTWPTCSVLSSRKIPNSVLLVKELNTAPDFRFLDLATQISRICTAGGKQDLIFHYNNWTLFKRDDQTRNSEWNSVASDALMSNRHKFRWTNCCWRKKLDECRSERSMYWWLLNRKGKVW